jgi:hypothetical protein
MIRSERSQCDHTDKAEGRDSTPYDEFGVTA